MRETDEVVGVIKDHTGFTLNGAHGSERSNVAGSIGGGAEAEPGRALSVIDVGSRVKSVQQHQVRLRIGDEQTIGTTPCLAGMRATSQMHVGDTHSARLLSHSVALHS